MTDHDLRVEALRQATSLRNYTNSVAGFGVSAEDDAKIAEIYYRFLSGLPAARAMRSVKKAKRRS